MDQNLDAVHHKLNVKLSPHVKADDAAKRPTHWIVATIITLVLGLFVAGSLGSLIFETVFGKSEAGTIKAQLSELFVFLFTLAIIFIWVKFKEGRPFRTVGFLGRGGLAKFGLGFVVGAVLIVLPTAALFLSGQYVHDVSRVGSTLGLSALWIVVLLLIVWAVQATTEEIAMRGYLLQTFGRQLPAWVAVLVPSILFAILHIGATPIALVNILLVAIFFSFLSLGQGSIWMAAGIHTAWNMVQGNILGVPVSGIPHSVTIWAFSPATDAPQWLTGGIFGIEASAAATICLPSPQFGVISTTAADKQLGRWPKHNCSLLHCFILSKGTGTHKKSNQGFASSKYNPDKKHAAQSVSGRAKVAKGFAKMSLEKRRDVAAKGGRA